MSDISGISGSHSLTSKTRVSLETAQNIPQIEPSMESQAMEKLSIEMEQLNRGFALMREIRASLESALKDLTPH